MGKNLTSRNLPQPPAQCGKMAALSAEKISYEILGNFCPILSMDCLNYCFIIKLLSFPVIFTYFDISTIAISQSTRCIS